MKRKALFCLFLIMTMCFNIPFNMSVKAADTVDYDWGNVPVGGFGYVTGVVFHPFEKDLIYIRTDMGGSYRFVRENESWVQLQDMFGVQESNFYGIDGIALDPKNPDVVYMASGKYTYMDGDVLKSEDRGKTWIKTGSGLRFGSNSVGHRNAGERIAVDPANSSIVFAGSHVQGLYVTEDAAMTWERVMSFPSQNNIANIVFDPNSAADGKSQTIYAGVWDEGIYRSQDAGLTWKLLEGTPKNVRRMDIAPSGALYIAETTGLRKFHNDKWEDITPEHSVGKSHASVNVHPEDENILLCMANSTSLMYIQVYLSMDGGKTWVNKREHMIFNPMTPALKYSHENDFTANACDMKFNPHNPKEVFYTDYFGAYIIDDIFEEPCITRNVITGIEETVVRHITTPPTGKYSMFVALADIDGFAFSNPTKFPDRPINQYRRDPKYHPWIMSATSVPFCEEDPNIVFRVGLNWNTHGKAEISLDGTESWTIIENGLDYYVDADGKFKNYVQFGKALVSSTKHPDTGKAVLMMVQAYKPTNTDILPEGTQTLPKISFDYGETWQYSNGLPAGTNLVTDYWNRQFPVEADKVKGNIFYASNGKEFFLSEDWGQNFTKVADIPGIWNKNRIRSVPGMPGTVWIAVQRSWIGGNDGGLLMSSDYGRTWEQHQSITTLEDVAFGKEAPGRDNPTAYTFATLDGTEGMYRSLDMGKTWQRINDERNQLGAVSDCIGADRQHFGIVYVGSDGRGIYLGMPKGAAYDFDKEDEDSAVFDGLPRIHYNGKRISFVEQPIIANDTLMVPLREFMKYFDAKTEWNDTDMKAIVRRRELGVELSGLMVNTNVRESVGEFFIGRNTAYLNGVETPLKEAPYMINGRMYVPLEAVAAAFGVKMDYNIETLMCYIEDEALIMYD